jgi:hypothetical protein
MTFTENVNALVNEFRDGQYSVKEFQFKLESLLYSYRELSGELEDRFRGFINELEIVLYTIPERQQVARAEAVGQAVLQFIEQKRL